jgi:hypothetical protein
MGYHVRSGRHAITRYDWEQYVAFVRSHMEDTVVEKKNE